MKIDQLAKQTHRRGVLAAIAGLLALPITAKGQAITCSPRGGGCTLLIPCCGHVRCTQINPLNPNSGVCGGVVRDTSPGPVFISPSSGGGSAPDRTRSGAGPSDPPGSINCSSFRCLEEAQAYYDADPSDPEGLDGPPGPASAGIPGRVCEGQLPPCSEVA